MLSSKNETGPLVVLEYMAAGCRSSPPTPGEITRAVRDLDVGFVPPPRDHREMAAGPGALLAMTVDERRAMGERGRRAARERFDQPIVTREIEAIYRRVGRRHPTGGSGTSRNSGTQHGEKLTPPTCPTSAAGWFQRRRRRPSPSRSDVATAILRGRRHAMGGCRDPTGDSTSMEPFEDRSDTDIGDYVAIVRRRWIWIVIAMVGVVISLGLSLFNDAEALRGVGAAPAVRSNPSRSSRPVPRPAIPGRMVQNELQIINSRPSRWRSRRRMAIPSPFRPSPVATTT